MAKESGLSNANLNGTHPFLSQVGHQSPSRQVSQPNSTMTIEIAKSSIAKSSFAEGLSRK